MSFKMQLHILATGILNHPYDMHFQHLEKHIDTIHLNELESLPSPKDAVCKLG